MRINLKYNKLLIANLPQICHFLKRYLLKKILAKVGFNFVIGFDFTFTNPENVFIGDDVFINNNFYCSNEKELIIGDRVMFGANCSIIGGDHKYDDLNECMRFNSNLGDNRQIHIEEDCWIGHGSIILKRTKIREGSIIGAGSVINTETNPYCIYAGNPARFIKPRFKTIIELNSYLRMMKETFDFDSKYTIMDFQAIYEKRE